MPWQRANKSVPSRFSDASQTFMECTPQPLATDISHCSRKFSFRLRTDEVDRAVQGSTGVTIEAQHPKSTWFCFEGSAGAGRWEIHRQNCLELLGPSVCACDRRKKSRMLRACGREGSGNHQRFRDSALMRALWRWGAARDGVQLFERGGDCSAASGPMGMAGCGKTGQRGDHRPLFTISI